MSVWSLRRARVTTARAGRGVFPGRSSPPAAAAAAVAATAATAATRWQHVGGAAHVAGTERHAPDLRARGGIQFEEAAAVVPNV